MTTQASPPTKRTGKGGRPRIYGVPMRKAHVTIPQAKFDELMRLVNQWREESKIKTLHPARLSGEQK